MIIRLVGKCDLQQKSFFEAFIEVTLQHYFAC